MKSLVWFLVGVFSLSNISIRASTQTVEIERSQSRDSLKENVSKEFREFVHGSKEMMYQYEKFVDTLNRAVKENRGLTEKDAEKILDALVYSAKCHQQQIRKNLQKTPYVSHPISVAEIVLTLGQVRDKDIIIAALLHDTIENTQATYQEISKRFGSKVEGYVREVTLDKDLSSVKKKKLQIIQAPNKSKGAATVLLADHAFNLNNLIQDAPADWTRERIDLYFQWVQSVVDRLPDANSGLKANVNQIIDQYWQKQS